jgi:glutamate-1-semialdehyde 2,1-aminomutase
MSERSRSRKVQRREDALAREDRIEALKQRVRNVIPESGDLFHRGVEVYPNGEISAARMFDPWPFYAVRGDGPYIWDSEGHKYIDCCMCYGVLLLGHRPPPIIQALERQLGRATHYGCPHPEEVEFGEKFVSCVPGADMLVLCNSGNEAIHKAVSIARAYTGKERVAKFEGGFHGSNEYSMWSVHLDPDRMGPANQPNPIPHAAGMTRAHRENLLLLPFGEESAFELIRRNAGELAVVMVEPAGGAGGGLTVGKEFLGRLREVTQESGVLLLFDEVITGFRLALGGGQEYFGVLPDLATFGKALGGGMAIGAIGVKRDILLRTLELDPPLSVAGSFSGNAMTLAAGNAFLDYVIANPQIYSELEEQGDYLRRRFNAYAREKGYPTTMIGMGSMWQIVMAPPPINKPRDLIKEDPEALKEFALRLRLAGIFIPAPLHLAFISPAHSDQDIEDVLQAAESCLDATFDASSIG